MADATTARSDSASRDATPRLAIPLLRHTQISCVSPFYDRDSLLDQASAMARLLARALAYDEEAERLAALARKPAPGFKELNGELFRDALDGISSLIAVHRHLEDVERAEKSNARLDQQEGR